MSTPEGAVLRDCLRLLKLHRIAAWRINIQGVPLHGQPGRFRPAPSRGIADIIGILPPRHVPQAPGRPLAVEVKSGSGRQSEHQAEFEKEWTGAGGVYWLVRSAAELEALLSAE